MSRARRLICPTQAEMLYHHMANMQILGRFADERMNFSVPVTDLRGD